MEAESPNTPAPGESQALPLIARLLPGLLAASLALIYLVGSLNASGSFARDGISVAAVRLLSLEQILVRGVSVVTQPMAVLVLAVAMLAVYFGPQEPSQAQRGVARRVLRRLSPKQVIAAWFCLAVLLAVVASWRLGLITAVFSLCLLFEDLLPAPPDPIAMKRRVRIMTAGIGVVIFLTSAYLGAFVQPLVDYRTNASKMRRVGVLVTHTNSTWYIAIENDDDKTIEAVSDRAMRDTHLFYRHTSDGASLLSILSNTLN